MPKQSTRYTQEDIHKALAFWNESGHPEPSNRDRVSIHLHVEQHDTMDPREPQGPNVTAEVRQK